MPHERRQQTVWSLICLFGNRLLFCFMARSTLSFWWSARFIFGPVLCPFLRALRNLCQQRRCSFVSVGSEIFAQWLTDDGWQQGRASRTLLMRFKQGQVFYMQCAYLWLTACMSQCDPSHQTLARDMSQSTYHSDMNGWAPPLIPLLHRRGPPGLLVWTGTSGLSGTEEIHTRSHFTDLSHVTAVTGSSFFCLQFSDLHEFLDISVTLWAEGNISEASGGSKEDVIVELLRRRFLFIIENIKYTAVWHAGFSFFNTKPTISKCILETGWYKLRQIRQIK